jgi:hypothetical protein
MSTVIAHTADALFIAAASARIVVSDLAGPTHVQAFVASEPKGAMTYVRCPGEVDGAEHEVLIVTLQDVQALEEGRCEMRS